MKAFIVGKYIAQVEEGTVWEFIGCFLNEHEAIDACIKGNYCVGPIKVGDAFPDRTVEWPGAYYPRLEMK